ncbi:right-handed parallel beta-helix repeat-containing protein [Microbacterium sp. AZCO]|uniref:right-handed parallel beta-helix repeat-containing protein n=1 Tax=Microbacterium sp. AZCO TaxID=3142976 RepID=UPI0031F40DE7
MSALQRFLGTCLLVVVVIAAATLAAVALHNVRFAGFGAADGTSSGVRATGRAYPGDPDREAALVAAERGRLAVVKELSAAAPWRLDSAQGPFVVPTTPAPTLVLPPRAQPYGLADVRRLTANGVQPQPDGSLLLAENLVVMPGAVLQIADAGTTVKLLSTPTAFVSIVTLGGSLAAGGAAGAPVTFTSFDPSTGAADTDTRDGRAYVRIGGGAVDLHDLRFADLGFWSGDTGGLALTGDEAAPQPALAPAARQKGAAPTLTPDQVATVVSGSQAAAGPISGVVRNVESTGNAFGIFVSGAKGLAIQGASVTGSLVDGISLHRAVTDTTIDGTTVTGSAVDGVSIGRTCGSVRMTGVTLTGSGRDGLSVDARPLADGPSATGQAIGGTGHIDLAKSVVADNGGYGISLRGGQDLAVTGTQVRGSVVGIVVSQDATGVDIDGNTFQQQERQAIALRDGVADTTIHANRMASIDTGVYLRGAAASVSGNSFRDISNHAVTMTGSVIGTRVTGNTISGHGSTPVYDDALGGHVASNDLDGWKRPVTPGSIVHAVAQPLTLVWVSLGVLLILTAILHRRRSGVRHPFAEQVPLTQLSRGIVSPESLRGGDHARHAP